jgi:hypothetical protein
MSQVEKNTLRMYGKNNYGGLYWPKQDGNLSRHDASLTSRRSSGVTLPKTCAETLKRHADRMTRFPLWWLVDAPYFQRDYTVTKASAGQPEMMGMLFPIERWVVGADAATLAGYLASAPSVVAIVSGSVAGAGH